MKEILLIKTSESEKIKALLDKNNTDYEIVYKDAVNLSEEEIYRRDMRLANQDKGRQKEIKFWDKIQDKDNAKLNNREDNEWDWN
jgi:4-diphosphocytidyl-2C-methyl-D-erythritol kinase